MRDQRSRSSVLVTLALALLIAASLPGVVSAHNLDHPPPSFSQGAPLSSAVNAGGEGAEWELITTIPTGNPHTDIDFFTHKGDTYASVGTLAIGPNGGGQSIIRLTVDGEIDPSFVTGHPSATCVSNPSAALGLQHDIEATPKGEGILNNDSYLDGVKGDAQLLIDATDAEGRCHDQGTLGLQAAPQGGLELIDITGADGVEGPKEIGLTSHIGEAHTVHVDPKRPHIAYAISSDSVGVTLNDNGTPNNPDDDRWVRANETEGSTSYALDGFEVVDMSSCMNFPAGATLDQKREGCRPEVFRYRYPNVEMALGHTLRSSIYACHELEIYPNDLITCGSGAAAIVFDVSGAFDDNGTPDDYTDDKPRGEPLPCRVRGSSTSGPTSTGAMITDCVVGGTEQEQVDLRVANWLKIGAPSLEGVTHVGSVIHQGRAATGDLAPTDSAEDIDFNHETELTRSGRYLLATDERGGGVAPPGATCAPGVDNPQGNGGVHAYRMDTLFSESTDSPEVAYQSYARTLEGEKAIFRAEIRSKVEATTCTAHVFQQIPGQTRIFMGWYSQGTQVVDYIELPDGGLEFREAGWFIPENANTWVSHIFKFEENPDTPEFTYYGATGDFNIGNAGRNAIDIFKVTLPPPPTVCDVGPEADIADRTQVRETHRRNVDCVIYTKIAQGYPPAAGGKPTYRPLLDVTREQMATFIANVIRAGGGTLPAGGSDQFSDIASSVHRANINALARAGIVKGTGEGEYSPKGRVSRQQMATFMVQATEFVLDTDLTATGDHFSDVAASNVHHGNINAGFEADLFSGTKAPEADKPRSGEFSPGVRVLRDQMASFLINQLDKTGYVPS